MTYCFQCRIELPNEAMIYCLDCRQWPDDEIEQETVIRDLTPAPPTLLGQRPTLPREAKSKTRLLAGAATGILILAGVFLFTREGSRPEPAANAESAQVAVEDIQQAAAHGSEETLAKPAPSITPKPRSTAELNVVAAIKPLTMRTRIEIVDGVERCYAIPGGREIAC